MFAISTGTAPPGWMSWSRNSFAAVSWAGCELYVVQTLAAEDVDPQRTGAVRLSDVETGRRLSAELDEVDLENYREVFGNFRDSLRRYCGRRGIGLWQFRSDWGVDACLE